MAPKCKGFDNDGFISIELYVNMKMVIDSPNQYKSQCLFLVPSGEVVLQLPDEAWYMIINPTPIRNGDINSNDCSVGAERTL